MHLRELGLELDAEEHRRIEGALALIWRQALGAAQLQGRVAELRKVDASPVTVVDLLHQTQFQELLRRDFAGDALLCEEPRHLQERHGEEAAELSRSIYGVEVGACFEELPTAGRRVWVLDPIDGTKGFLAGRYFAIAIAYFVDGGPFFAAMAVPGGDRDRPLEVDRSLAFAVAGQGAWATKVRAGAAPAWAPLPGPGRDQGPVRVAVSLAHGGPLAERLRATSGVEVVELDSQAKYLAVATGDIDAYLRAARDDGGHDLLWDHLPGGLIAREAGCAVTHFDGSPVVYAAEERVPFRGGMVCLRERGGDLVSRTVAGLLRRAP
jgi:3'(2'), 5'-bisphosphate nucleotidase